MSNELHFPPSSASRSAHILADVLSSGGISAAVTGDIANQLYGGTPMLDCVVLVPHDEMEEAEAFLLANFTEEAPDTDIPAETCPPDGDPPGVGAILYGTLHLAPLAAIIPGFLVGIQNFGTHPTSLLQIFMVMVLMYLSSLLILIACLPFFSVGAGLLLHILRGYHSGSKSFRVIFSIFMWGIILVHMTASVLCAFH